MTTGVDDDGVDRHLVSLLRFLPLSSRLAVAFFFPSPTGRSNGRERAVRRRKTSRRSSPSLEERTRFPAVTKKTERERGERGRGAGERRVTKRNARFSRSRTSQHVAVTREKSTGKRAREAHTVTFAVRLDVVGRHCAARTEGSLLRPRSAALGRPRVASSARRVARVAPRNHFALTSRRTCTHVEIRNGDRSDLRNGRFHSIRTDSPSRVSFHGARSRHLRFAGPKRMRDSTTRREKE